MGIKQAPRQTRKQKAYLKWMGLEKPKKVARLPQLQKFNRKMARLTGQSRTFSNGGWIYE